MTVEEESGGRYARGEDDRRRGLLGLGGRWGKKKMTVEEDCWG